MGNKLYVGNLPYTVRDEDLQQSFSQYGSVSSAKVMMERDTGRSKGFGFVEMGNDAEAQAAIAGMNGQSLGGRSITWRHVLHVAVVSAAVVAVAAATVVVAAIAPAVAATVVAAAVAAAATKPCVNPVSALR